MNTKVAAISMCNERAWQDGTLVYHYTLPGMSLAEVEGIADFYYDKMAKMVAKAASEGAQIGCLPENTIEINKWLKAAEPSARFELARRNWDRFVNTLSALAKAHEMVLVACSNEIDDDNRIYNAAAVCDERGNYLGSYRKVQLVRPELEWLTRGDAFPTFPTRYGRLGVFICWDIMFPEAVQTLSKNGAELLCQPTYGHAGPIADAMARTRAYDAVCPLVVSMWNGNSRIIDADGTVLSKTHRTRDWQGIIPDQIIYADVDPMTPRCRGFRDDFKAAWPEERQVAAYEPLLVG